MSAAIGAALKKIAVALLTDKKVIKTIVGVVLGIIMILVMPIIAVVSNFNGSIDIDAERYNYKYNYIYIPYLNPTITY